MTINSATENTQPTEATTVSCQYPDVICAQLRWLQRRVFYQFMQTGCPTIDLEADLDITRNQADLTQRLSLPIPPLVAMPQLLRGSVRHASADHAASSTSHSTGAV